MVSGGLSGVFPALTTPFENGDLSVARLRANIERFNRTDLSGYLVLGSTGEAVLMNEREGITAIEAVRSSAASGRKIIAGTGMQSTRSTIEFTNLAAGAGADYALVVTPFYYKSQMRPNALETYYIEVADKSRIPVLLYNVPKFTGLDLPLATIVSLAGHPNIVGLKESSGSIAFFTEVIKACPPDFAVLQGSGSLLFPSLALGATGGILALSNMAPAETVEIFKLVQSGDLKAAREIQVRLITANQMIVERYSVPGIKCALDLLGYFGGDPRPPLKPSSEEIKNSIRDILKDARLL